MSHHVSLYTQLSAWIEASPHVTCVCAVQSAEPTYALLASPRSPQFETGYLLVPKDEQVVRTLTELQHLWSTLTFPNGHIGLHNVQHIPAGVCWPVVTYIEAAGVQTLTRTVTYTDEKLAALRSLKSSTTVVETHAITHRIWMRLYLNRAMAERAKNPKYGYAVVLETDLAA